MQVISNISIPEIKGTLHELKNLNKPYIWVRLCLIENGNPLQLKIKALIDTGAPVSFISDRITEPYNLICKNPDALYPTHFNGVNKGQYEVSVLLSETQTEPVKLLFGKFNDEPTDPSMIIGTDILANFEFLYNKPKGIFKLKLIE